jgi:hypothetical protein
MSPYLTRSLLALMGLLLPLVLIEVGLRAFGPILPGNYETGVWAQADPVVGHVHTPGSEAWVREPEFVTYLRFNSLGLRGDEPPPEAAARRVLALGDSFIEAKQVSEDQTLTALLSRGTSGTDAPRAAWLNGGVFDWGPVQEYLYLREAGPTLAPDLVLQFFYVGNDIADCFPRSRGEVRELERPMATTAEDGSLELLPWTSHRQSPAEAFLGSLGRRSSALRAFESGVVDKLRYQPRSQHPIESQLLRIYGARESAAETRAWETIDGLLTATRDESARLGAAYALVIVPGKWQVHREDWAEVLAERDEPADDRWALGRPNKRLARLATARDIPVLDLLPVMRDASSRGLRLYYQRDIHWNAAGHAVAADAVARFVADEGLLQRQESSAPGSRANR